MPSNCAKTFSQRIKVQTESNNKTQLEGCIDDERQFKTAKRSQVPGDATVLKRFLHVIFRRTSKRIKE